MQSKETSNRKNSANASTNSNIYVKKLDDKLWEPSNNKSLNPGISFLNTQPLELVFSQDQDEQNTVTSSGEENILNLARNQLQPKTIEECLNSIHAPISIKFFQPLQLMPVPPTVNLPKLFHPSLSFISCRFIQFQSEVPVFEPIIASLYLYDIERSQKLSESWRFLANPDITSINSKIALDGFISQSIIQAPHNIIIPNALHSYPKLMIVLTLDRLVLHEGGASLNKYYAKPQPKTEAPARADLEECNQNLTSSTFAFSIIEMNSIRSGTMNDYTVDSFYQATFPSDDLIQLALNHKLEKQFPFSLRFSFSSIENHNFSDKLLEFYFPKITLMPRRSFESKILFHAVQVKLHPPKNSRARTVLMIISFMGRPILTSKAQYHVENPMFDDTVVIDLPPEMPKISQLEVKFYQLSVKHIGPNEPQVNSRIEIGTSIINLFDSDCIISNGEHKTPIISGNDDDNLFIFNTALISTCYSTNPFVHHVFTETFKEIRSEPTKDVIISLYPLLDHILQGIIDEKQGSVTTLMHLLDLFSANDSTLQDHLMFYSRFCAFRQYKRDIKSFHCNLSKIWLNYCKATSFKTNRADLVSLEFLLELMTKSFAMDTTLQHQDFNDEITLFQTLTGYFWRYRLEGHFIGKNVHLALVHFVRNSFEFSPIKLFVPLLRAHLNVIDSKAGAFDRNCLCELLRSIAIPKIIIFLTMPKENKPTLFQEIFAKDLEKIIDYKDDASTVFHILYNIIVHLDTNQQKQVSSSLFFLLHVIGRKYNSFFTYVPLSLLLYPLAVCHFIVSTTPPIDSKQNTSTDQTLKYINSNLEKLHEYESSNTLGQYNASRELNFEIGQVFKLMIKFGQSYNNIVKSWKPAKSPKEFQKAHFQLTKTIIFKSEIIAPEPINIEEDQTDQKENEKNQNILDNFDSLGFSIQSLLISFIPKYNSIFIETSIISPLFEVTIFPSLASFFIQYTTDWMINHSENVFVDPRSELMRIISLMFSNPNMPPEYMNLITKLRNIEKKKRGVDTRTTAAVCRAILKYPPSENITNLFNGSCFGEIIAGVYKDNQILKDEKLKIENPDFYAEAMYNLADHVSTSPDARVEALLNLSQYHYELRYYSEAIIDKLTCAALVAEYLSVLGKIPNVFSEDHPVLAFADICPSAISEFCPNSVLKDLPRIKSYCSSKYFSEFGLIYLIQDAMNTCLKAELYELITKMHHLVGPLVEKRHLWNVLAKTFIKGANAWNLVDKYSTSTDRHLGTYYRVQFQDSQGVYIYRETELASLWTVTPKIIKSAAILANGKPVEGINEGTELDPKLMDPDKFYVHVKAVQPYFSPEESKRRITVFEKNYNVNQFYFDLPFYDSGSDKSIEHTWLRRTVITLPHPMPYIVKRMFVSNSDIKVIEYSPIAKCCLDLSLHIAKINEAVIKHDFNVLQPLLQGALLAQVNEGPKKMAEVFLRGNVENQDTENMRELFREFLQAVSDGVKIHEKHATKNPVWSSLQEQLEMGLNDLMTSLQPYIK